jgi:hypothetical protein
MKAIILTNDRKVKFKKVNPSKLWFNYRGKLYDLDPTAIVMEEKENRDVIAKPQLFYFENSSEPIKYTAKPGPDPSGGYREKYLKLNTVRTQHKPSFMSRLIPVLGRFAGLFTMQNFILIIVAGSMIYSFLQGYGIL